MYGTHQYILDNHKYNLLPKYMCHIIVFWYRYKRLYIYSSTYKEDNIIDNFNEI